MTEVLNHPKMEIGIPLFKMSLFKRSGPPIGIVGAIRKHVNRYVLSDVEKMSRDLSDPVLMREYKQVLLLKFGPMAGLNGATTWYVHRCENLDDSIGDS